MSGPCCVAPPPSGRTGAAAAGRASPATTAAMAIPRMSDLAIEDLYRVVTRRNISRLCVDWMAMPPGRSYVRVSGDLVLILAREEAPRLFWPTSLVAYDSERIVCDPNSSAVIAAKNWRRAGPGYPSLAPFRLCEAKRTHRPRRHPGSFAAPLPRPFQQGQRVIRTAWVRTSGDDRQGHARGPWPKIGNRSHHWTRAAHTTSRPNAIPIRLI